MDPKKLLRDLAQIDHRLTELDARTPPARDIEAEAMSLIRHTPKERDMPSFAEDFTSPLSRRTLTAGGSGQFAGADGKLRDVRVDQNLTSPGSHPQMPDIARPTQPGVVSTLTRPAPVAPAPPRTMSTRHDPNGYAVSQAQRSLDMAQNQAQFNAKKVGLTRTQRQAMGASDQAGIGFWRDQANSLGPGAANRMAELQAQQQNENFRTLTRNAAGAQTADANNEAAFQRTLIGEQGQAQRSAADNAARLAAEQIQRDGAMDRQAEQNRFALTRPQAPTQLADGTLVYASPANGLQRITDEQGNPVRGLTPQPAQPTGLDALGRLTGDLTPQFLGADNYGMVPDESVPKGRRPATAEDRQAAIRAATAAARETLGIQNPAASSQPAPQPSPQASTAQPGTPRGSLDDFINAAMKSNPDYSREELAAYYAQRHGNR